MNLIVASHGTLCEGLADAFHMLASSEIPITTVSLNETGIDDFRDRLVAEVQKSKSTAKTLILTDLYGGTPFNESFALYLADPENLRVVAGVNFPMLIEAGMAAPDTDDLDEIVSIAVQAGTAGVVAASAEPDMPAKIKLAKMFTYARPPRKWPRSARQKLKIRVAMPPAFIMIPAIINMGMARRTKLLRLVNILSIIALGDIKALK